MRSEFLTTVPENSTAGTQNRGRGKIQRRGGGEIQGEGKNQGGEIYWTPGTFLYGPPPPLLGPGPY